MKGLFYKDFITVWDAYKKNLLLVLIMYGVLAYTMEIDFMLFAMVFLLGLYAVSSLGFDENCKWDAYARTLPVSPGQQVAVKYLLGFAWMGLGLVLAFAMSLVLGFLRGEDIPAYLIPVASGCSSSLFVVLLYNAITYPLSYKYGSTKARTAVMMVLAFIFLGLFVLMRFLPKGWLNEIDVILAGQNETTLLLLTVSALVVLGLAAYLVSWAISTAIYKRKEY